MPEGLKYKLISEKSVKPKLSQYSIPDELLDKTYEMHEFLIECDDMNELFKMLWFIPVRHIIPDENDAIFTRSYRTVPQGKCLIDQYSAFLNNIMLTEPIADDTEVKLDMINDNNDKTDIVGYPIIYNKQFLGYLLPNSVLDEHFKIVEASHPGIHYTYGFYRKGLPKN